LRLILLVAEMTAKPLRPRQFYSYLLFVVDYVTRVRYDSGTIQNCA
jgi:hypothetical protein